MAYRREASRDIRSMHVSNIPPSPASEPAHSISENETYAVHNPLKEMQLIFIIALPLIIAVFATAYFDSTRHWVVPFAEYLFTLGRK